MVAFQNPGRLPHIPLFDVHVHLGSSDTGEVYYPALSVEEYRELMSASGVRRACAFAPQQENGYAASNEAIRRWSDESNGAVLGFARLSGRHIALTRPHVWLARRKAAVLLRRQRPDLDTLQALERYDGVKLLPQFDGLPGADTFARIAELQLPVLVHGGTYSRPAWIEKAVVSRVTGPVIIAHLGAFPCDASTLHEAVDVASRRSNVYLDTSGIWASSFLRYAVERVPDKILFGSDAPLAHPLVAWHHVESIVRQDDLLERIGWKTAQTLFAERSS